MPSSVFSYNLGMSFWVISSNPKTYDADRSLQANGEIDWVTKNNFAVGDTVYIYEVIPPRGRGGIVYETEVVKADISTDQKIDDREFWAGGNYPEDLTAQTRFSRLKIVGKPAGGAITLETLKKYGFTPPQSSAHNLGNNPGLLSNIRSHFRASSNQPVNTFKHQIFDGIVHPDDQQTLDKYVIYHAVAASSMRPKRDALYVVTLDDGRKVMAKWQGQRALELHSDKNLIKQTTNRDNVRYYIYLSEADGSEVVSTPRLYHKIARTIATNTDDEVAEEITSEDTSLDEITATLEALTNTQPPERVERIVSKVVRNPKIAQLVKERQGYICEVCSREPFVQKNGNLYAEADHIKPLGLGGLDTPDNMRCLCSQCHAVITHGSNETIRGLLVV
jgi:predicted HNH restriction endonuclease